MNEVRKIDQPGDLEIVTELIRIFNIETDPLIVARDTYILGYKQENIEKFHQFKEQKSNVEDLINIRDSEMKILGEATIALDKVSQGIYQKLA